MRRVRGMPSPTYSTVVPEGSTAYVAPHAPDCPASERYMAVHRTDGGWGMVDRRYGRLVREERAGQHRYAGWMEVQAAVEAMNRV